MTAAHFIYIPSILLLGIVIGWILGSRAAADAYAVQARRDHERRSTRNSPSSGSNSENDSRDRA
jgi:hypothetical protein